MADLYRRKQMLLRREDGVSAGFLRIEQQGQSCHVSMQMNGAFQDLRIVLLGKEDTLSLGNVSRDRTLYIKCADALERYEQAAVFSADRLISVAGEGADFKGIRRRLEREAQAEIDRRFAREKKMQQAVTDAAIAAEQTRQEMPKEQEQPLLQETAPIQAQAAALVPEDTEEIICFEEPPQDGWVFTSFHQDTCPCYTGYLLKGGRRAATLYAVTGAYMKEPPPGLTGFVWDSGFWVKVIS